jgi:hypothetical protein
MLSDGAVLMLTDLIHVEPSVLSAVRVQADGSLGNPFTVTSLSNGGDIGRAPFYQTSITAASDDGAFVAWREYIPNGHNSGEIERLMVRRYRSQGGLQTPAQIRAQPTGSVDNYALAAMPGNGAVVAWVESLPYDPVRDGQLSPTSLFVATYSDAGGWSTAIQLDDIGIHDVAVGASPDGHIVVMWSVTRDIAVGDVLMAAHRDPSGHWGSPAVVYETNYTGPVDTFGLGVAVDDLGNAMAVWEYKSWDEQVHRSGFNRLDASSGWSGDGILSDFAVNPTVVVNARGEGLIAWGDDGNVHAVNFDRAGFGTATVLSTPEADTGAAQQPQATISEDGRGAVVWNQDMYHVGIEAHVDVRGARFTSGVGWSSNSTLSSVTEVAVLSHLTNSRDGRAAAIWSQGDLSGGQSSFWLMPFALAE